MTERERLLWAARMVYAKRAEAMGETPVPWNWESVLMVLIGPDAAIGELDVQKLRGRLGVWIANADGEQMLDQVRQDIRRMFPPELRRSGSTNRHRLCEGPPN